MRRRFTSETSVPEPAAILLLRFASMIEGFALSFFVIELMIASVLRSCFSPSASCSSVSLKPVEPKYFIPLYYAPKFTASQNLKDYVNDAIVSKEGRRNKKRGTLTQLEKELEERELEKNKTDIRRMLERKMATGENIKDIAKDSRMQMRRRS